MSRFLLAVIFPIILSVGACASSGVQITGTQEVRVPIPVRCDIAPVNKPELPFDTQATKDMSLFDKVRLLLAQNSNLQGYTEELVSAIDVCAKAPIPDPLASAPQ